MTNQIKHNPDIPTSDNSNALEKSRIIAPYGSDLNMPRNPEIGHYNDPKKQGQHPVRWQAVGYAQAKLNQPVTFATGSPSKTPTAYSEGSLGHSRVTDLATITARMRHRGMGHDVYMLRHRGASPEEFQNITRAHELQHDVLGHIGRQLSLTAPSGDVQSPDRALPSDLQLPTSRQRHLAKHLIAAAKLTPHETHFLRTTLNHLNGYDLEEEPEEAIAHVVGLLHGGGKFKENVVADLANKLPGETARSFDKRLKAIHKKVQGAMSALQKGNTIFMPTAEQWAKAIHRPKLLERFAFKYRPHALTRDKGGDLEKSQSTLVPPDFGTIHPDVLDHKSAFEFAGRHSRIAMDYAQAGMKDAAVHHHKQAQAYTNFIKQPTVKVPVTKGEGDMPNKEQLQGGLADGKSLKDIAEKHNVSLADLQTQFEMGQKVELEHTSEQAQADEIVRDHLWEDPKYYSKLEEMEAKKTEVEDKTMDPVAGLEPLKKPIAKSIAEYWDLLKAKISAESAFIDADELAGTTEDKAPAEEAGAEQPQQEDAGQDQEQPQEGGDQEQQISPEEVEQAHADQGQEQQQEQQISPEEVEQAHADQGQEQQQEGDQDQEQPAMDPEEIAAAMREEGYSDHEIAYILHGHVPPIASAEDHAATNERLDGQLEREHTKREADAKHAHATKLQELEQKKKEAELASMDPDLERDHRRRLKELEYEKARKAMDAEDHDGEKEHKRKLREMELKIKQAEIDARLDSYGQHHKQRLADLEYEKAKKDATAVDPTDEIKAQQAKFELEIEKKRAEFEMEMEKKLKELELKYKEKELQLNLRLKEEAAKLKSQQQEEQMHLDHKVNMQVKQQQAKHKVAAAKQAPEKEPVKGAKKDE